MWHSCDLFSMQVDKRGLRARINHGGYLHHFINPVGSSLAGIAFLSDHWQGGF
jgi:hypothetical protein